MTVSELIDKLKELPQDALVMTQDNENGLEEVGSLDLHRMFRGFTTSHPNIVNPSWELSDRWIVKDRPHEERDVVLIGS